MNLLIQYLLYFSFTGARHTKVLDEAVVRAEAWPVAHLQEPKDKKQPLGGHSHADLVSGD